MQKKEGKEGGIKELDHTEVEDVLFIKKKNVLFIIGAWNAKVGSQETPGITGRFGLEVC